MRDARLDGRWHRSAPVAVLGLLLAAAGTVQGCGDDEPPPNPNLPTGTTTGPGGGGGAGGVGGAGGTGGVNGDFTVVRVANDVNSFTSPFDAAPDPAGETVYFTGVNPDGDTGVFKVAATGGNIDEVAAGSPFVSPFGIAVSTDTQTLYVADVGAQVNEDEDRGLIFRVPSAGGSPEAISGAGSFRATSLEVRVEGGADFLYFSGTDAMDGRAGVFKIEAAGSAGGPEVVSKDLLLKDPSGIAVASDGTVYVADTIAGGDVTATIWSIDVGGGIKPIATRVAVGYPAGVALTNDETQVIVSGLNPATLTDALYIYDVAIPAPGTPIAFPMNIPVNTFFEPAGLHRARDVDVFAWVDSRANGTGSVYVISR